MTAGRGVEGTVWSPVVVFGRLALLRKGRSRAG